jgi:biopolymer transport protein ExbB
MIDRERHKRESVSIVPVPITGRVGLFPTIRICTMRLFARSCRVGVLSFLLGAFVLSTVAATIAMTTPATARAQEENKGDQPPDEQQKAKTSTNPIVHFFVSIGIVFGLLFAAISVGMVALIILLLLDLRLGEAVPTAFVDEFTNMVNKRQFKQAYDLCKADTSFLARVLTAGMGRLQYGIEDAREAMMGMVDTVRAGKDGWISYLATIGTLGPMLGLVGTVSGMVGAFRKLGEATGAPDATSLAGEISHALVVTLVGVAISVPAIFFYTFFKNRLTGITTNTTNLADDLLTQMYHNSRKATGAPATMPTEKGSTGVQTRS